MDIRIVRAEDLTAVPIADTGNFSTELYINPPGSQLMARDYTVRVSTAHLFKAGEFSKIFAGYHRKVMLLGGQYLELDITLPRGCREEILLGRPGTQCEFSGDSPVMSRLKRGPVRDFNIIYRREQVLFTSMELITGQLQEVMLDNRPSLGEPPTQIDLFFSFGAYQIQNKISPLQLKAGDVAVFEQDYSKLEVSCVIAEQLATEPIVHALIILP